MTRSRLLLLTVLLAALPVALAQRGPSRPSPTDLYHQGARLFVDGRTAQAERTVEAGLAADPGNAKLQALRDLIRQQQDQDQKQNGQGQGQPQPPQDSSGDQGQGDQSPPSPPDQGGSEGQPPPERPENSGGAQPDQTRAQPQPDASPQAQPPGQSGPTPADASGVPQGQMTRAQADRILDAVGGEERLLLREMRRAPTRARQSDKDW